jgi:hypothetical protein
LELNKKPDVVKIAERLVTKDGALMAAGNPGELKKTESGESDPGYESDSNHKLGLKKTDGVVVVVPVDKQPTSILFPKKKCAAKMIDIPSSRIDPKLVVSRDFEKCDEKRVAENWNKETSKSNHQIRAGRKEKGQQISYSATASNPSLVTSERRGLDRRESSDLIDHIISSSVIDEMSNINKPDSPITLEIFSPVMVR